MNRTCLFAALASLAACGGAAQPAASAAASDSLTSDIRPSHAELRRALFALDQFHSALIGAWGPVSGFMALVDDDATLLLANADIITGRPAIRSAVEGLYPAGSNASVKRTLVGGEVSADGSLGFTFGFVEQSATAGAASLTPHGTYIAVWQRHRGLLRVSAYFTRFSTAQHGTPRADFPLLVGNPGAAGAPHPGRPEAQLRSLLESDKQFAALSVAQGFSIAFPAWAGDFVLITGGRDHFYLEGQAEIIDWNAGWTPAEVLNWGPTAGGVSGSGDLGYTLGNYTDTFTDSTGVSIAYGKYINLWLRQPDGSWRYISDAGAASPTPSN